MLKKSLFQFYILFLCCLMNFYWIFQYGKIGDSVIFNTVKNLPEVNSWSYFWHILTHSNGFSLQYRPLGFFGYYYFMGNVFGDAVIPYYILSLVFLTLIAQLVKNWAENQVDLKYIGWFAALYFIFHSVVIYPTMDISCSGKYLLTGLIFMFEVNFIDNKLLKNDTRFDLFKSVIFFILNLIAVMLHEGCVVFPFVILLYYFLKKRAIDYWYFTSFIPVVIYLTIRLYIGFPEQGIMKIGLGRFFDNFNQSQMVLWSPIFNAIENGYLAFILVAIVALLIFKIKKLGDPLLFFIMSEILVLPFLFLERHLRGQIIVKGSFWAVFPSIFFVISIIALLHTVLKNGKKIIPYLLLLLITIQYFFSIFFVKNLRADRDRWTLVQNSYGDYLQEQISTKSKIIKITYSDILDTRKLEKDHYVWIILSEFYPAYLSKRFPHHTFIFTQSGHYNADGKEMEILVQNGYYVYIKNRDSSHLKVVDRFGYESTLHYTQLNENQLVQMKFIPYLGL